MKKIFLLFVFVLLVVLPLLGLPSESVFEFKGYKDVFLYTNLAITSWVEQDINSEDIITLTTDKHKNKYSNNEVFSWNYSGNTANIPIITFTITPFYYYKTRYYILGSTITFDPATFLVNNVPQTNSNVTISPSSITFDTKNRTSTLTTNKRVTITSSFSNPNNNEWNLTGTCRANITGIPSGDNNYTYESTVTVTFTAR